MLQLFTTILAIGAMLTVATVILGAIIWGAVFYLTRNDTIENR